MKYLNNKISSIFILITFSTWFNTYSQISDKTVIKGRVIDAKTGQPISGVSVFLVRTTVGTITNSEGKFNIETNTKADKIDFSFIGYQTESRTFSEGKVQIINVTLKLSSISLDEVVVKPGKKSYKNKDNPAVALIEKVIKNKDFNNGKRFDYLEYKQYEKIQFALSNISKRLEEGSFLRKFRFVFDNIDTTKRIGKSILPLYIKEELSDHYFRKDPVAAKEIIRAEKTINLDEYLDKRGVSANLNYLYQNINIYDNQILFLTNTFMSPICNNAPVFYKYYILDTLAVGDIKCVRLFFEPRNRADFLFHGHLYITMDSSYAVRKIDIGINKNINIDWVKDISIVQDFDQFGKKNWLLSKEEISIDFGILKNTLGLYGQRSIFYKDYKINDPIDNKIFAGAAESERLNPSADSTSYWEANRYVPLSKSERGVYLIIDSLKQIPLFRKRMDELTLLTSGFLNLGKIEIGPAESFYSYNSVEGSRFRFGGRTTPALSKKINFETYAAYGLRDKIWKYNAGVSYSFTKRTIYQFPVELIRLSYMSDLKIPGQELQFTQGDNIFLSVKRGINDKFFLNKTIKAEFLDEFQTHFSYLLGYSFTRQSTAGNLYFNTSDSIQLTNNIPYINISEFYLNLRYAPNEKFYQGKMYRDPFPGKYPVIQFKIAGGLKSIYNNYNYLRLQLGISRRYYLSVVGYSDVAFEAGKIFGQVSYPLLFIHNANQTYSYQTNSYNLMNFLEFVSDQYVSLNIDHCFNGFFFNKVPLLKKLKLREVVSLKVLYGGLSNNSNPDYRNNLFKFPVDANGIPLTYGLGQKPYIEASVGISNIFKIFRVDLIKRITYQNYPNVSSLGLRIQFRFDI